jgi:hydrogenase nickel incorporation protein HypB
VKQVVQINTEGGCHLNAAMVKKALESLELDKIDILIVENVGNLVCPASFDIGTKKDIVVASVPEGEDKPKKYPKMYRVADVVVLNKIDLIDEGFDIEKFRRFVKEVNPKAKLIEVSAKTGENMDKLLTEFEK